MYLQSGHLFHLFNQGNNRQKIFFTRENYLFFLSKIKLQILPYSDILAWCLMPNHFHLMLYINKLEEDLCQEKTIINKIAAVNNPNPNAFSSCPNTIKRTINESIGIMLRTYTRAVNKQENRTGSLFREETKAICLSQKERISENWFQSMGITRLNFTPVEYDYPNICFNYILNNPVKDGLVKRPEDWEFSSYHALTKKDDDLINIKRINEHGLVVL